MKISRLVALLATLLFPIFFFVVAYMQNLFEIGFDVLTLGHLWDSFWIAGVIWIGLSLLIGAVMYFSKQMTDTNGSSGFAGIAILPIALFWIITFFRGLWDDPISTLNIGILWDIMWIIVLIMIVVIVIIAVLGFLQIPVMGKRK